LLVTLAIGADVSWRWVYAALLMAELVVLVAVIARRDAFAVEVREPDDDAAARPINWRILSFMLAFFVFYVMIEASYGQWSYSILTEERAVAETAAGWAVASFWGGLTAGRLLLGAVGRNIRPEQLLSGSVLGVALGALLFWWDPVAGADLVALPLVGLAAAGVFPALVLLTPVWIGAEHTGRAVGYQLAASSAGVITISGLLGLLVSWRDLGVVAPVLFAIAVVMVLANVLTQRAGAAA
jgi:fucose permease